MFLKKNTKKTFFFKKKLSEKLSYFSRILRPICNNLVTKIFKLRESSGPFLHVKDTILLFDQIRGG